jgi:hypothetical protein
LLKCKDSAFDQVDLLGKSAPGYQKSVLSVLSLNLVASHGHSPSVGGMTTRIQQKPDSVGKVQKIPFAGRFRWFGH